MVNAALTLFGQSETEKLQAQIDAIEKQCVADLPKYWDQVA